MYVEEGDRCGLLIADWHDYECESKYHSTYLALLKVEIGRHEILAYKDVSNEACFSLT